MITPVRAFAALWLLGLGLGALEPPAPLPSAASFDGHTILAGDFHVHAFPGDGALTPGRLRDLAAEQGLDVITITNHNQTLASHVMPSGDPARGPIVLLGSEITNPAFHLIAVGITRDIDWNQPAAAIIDEVHAQGGVAIAAHPTRRFWAGWDDEAAARVDGVEVAHPILQVRPEVRHQFDEFLARVLARNPDIARIGSSDYHMSDAPGRCRTYLFARERSRGGVLEAIRAGRTVAERADGTLVGDPALVDRVRSHTRDVPSRTFKRQLSAVFAWVGMAGLMLSVPRRRR